MTIDDRARRAANDFGHQVDELERTTPARWSFQRYERYRRRRERNQRLAAAAVTIIIVIALFAAAAEVLRSEPSPQPAPGHEPTPVGVATGNGRIVFNEDVMHGDADFVTSYAVNPDGSELTQLGPAGPTVCGSNSAAWSPDGSTVVCQAYRNDMTLTTATVDGDGSTYRVLTGPDIPRNFACAAWSPDGTRLFCPFTSDGTYTISPEGSDLLRLTSLLAGGGPNGYMSDGSYVYLTVVDPTDRRTLYAVKTDGSEASIALSPSSVSIQDNDYFDAVSADSSPDGAQLAFVGALTQTDRALYIARVDGSGVDRVQTPDIAPTSAQWSPDGRWIALSARPTDAATNEAYLVHPDGTGLTPITSSSDKCSTYAPVWSPDGSKLLFETQCTKGAEVTSTTLQISNLDGSDVTNVVDLHGLTAYDWGAEPR